MASGPITLDLLSVGERIRALRGKRTQAEFAAALGSSRMSVVRYEAGSRMLDAEFLANLCHTYGADPMWVLTGDGMPPADNVVLAVDEMELLLNYRDSSAPVRRAALGALKHGSATAAPASRGPSTVVNVAGDVTGGQHSHTHNHAPGSTGVSYGKTVIKGKKRSE